ncbi:MAG: hypothetical protein ACSHXI_19280 [Hoeflea sp.]|uniref:hypothetical protein n=1 Tax=Hoeflea sp. TaxID=1940281 RepID=UPI003EF79A3A
MSQEDLTATFDALRPLFYRHADRCVVLRDEPHCFYLGTHEIRQKDGYRTGFGGVEINKRYVSAHLMPVYVHPDLLINLSPDLRKRMQGKSCFNFRQPDQPLFDELDELIKLGMARFDEDGKL